jgi:hypothetical protein
MLFLAPDNVNRKEKTVKLKFSFSFSLECVFLDDKISSFYLFSLNSKQNKSSSREENWVIIYVFNLIARYHRHRFIKSDRNISICCVQFDWQCISLP